MKKTEKKITKIWSIYWFLCMRRRRKDCKMSILESGKNFTSFSGAKFLRCNQKTPKNALNSLNYERNLILIHFQCHTMKLLWMWLTCLLIVYCRHRKLVFSHSLLFSLRQTVCLLARELTKVHSTVKVSLLDVAR